MNSKNLVFCYAMVALSALLYGTESVTVKLAYGGGWTVFSLLTARFTLAVLLFGAAVALTGSPWLVERQYRRRSLILIGTQLATLVCLFLAYDYLAAALATLFFYAYPSFTALIARIFYRKKLRALDVAALVLSALGLLLLYWSSSVSISPLGVMFALMSACAQGFRYNISEGLMDHISPIAYNFNAAVVIAIAGLVISLCSGADGFAFSALTAQGWLAMTFVAVVVTGAATFITMRFINRVGAVACSLLMLLEPPLAALLAWLVFGDQLTGLQLLGGALVLAAVVLPLLKPAGEVQTDD